MNQQIQMEDENLLPQDGTNPEVEVALEDTTTEEETVETPEQEKTYSKSEFNQVLARAKKAEALLKANPPKTPVQNINQNALSEEQVEIKILKAQGMNEELINELKAVAKARGKSLLDAQTDSIFVAIKNEREAEAKAQKAKLGASRGSGSVKKEKEISSPGLSDADHKELWKTQNGR